MLKVNYCGRMGNNLFQYCFGRIIATELSLYLDAAPIHGFPATYTIVNGNRYSHPVEVIVGHQVDLKGVINNHSHRQILLNGYFHRIGYYVPYFDKIKNDWLNMPHCPRLMPTIDKNDVVICIRRGDFTANYGEISFSFFEKAISIINPINKIYICHDDISDPFIKKFDKYNPIIYHQDYLDDFAFIKSFNNIILSTSTYYWWAAFLSQAEKVIFPLAQSCYWSGQRPEVDLKVNKDSYIYLKQMPNDIWIESKY